MHTSLDVKKRYLSLLLLLLFISVGAGYAIVRYYCLNIADSHISWSSESNAPLNSQPAAAALPFASPQILKPVTWDFSVKEISEKEAELIMHAKIDAGWHIFSQHISPDGAIPTTFKFTTSADYQALGKIEEPKAIEEDDPYMGKLLYFEDEVSFRQKIKLKNNGQFTVKGELTFMACKEVCIPPERIEFSFVINKGKTGTIQNIQPVKDTTGTGSIILPADSEKKKIDSAGVAAAQTPDDGQCHTKTFNGQTATEENSSLWSLVIFAFLAGLSSLITPCVFPMIPMTVTFFLKSSETRSKAIRNAVVYGLSIIGLFTLTGTLVAILVGPDFAHFLSTHWLPNIIFFVVFMLFAASFLGMFEIVLPSSWVNAMDKRSDKGGITGVIFMAFTLVLVSFSCTGPVVSKVITDSLSGEFIKPVLSMFSFSLAFALPFTLFAIFPNWLTSLPKSGGWLNGVKVTLGFIELALGFKFLSIADQAYHWGILDREVNIAIWIVIATLMGFYYLGKLKLPHDSDVKIVSVPRLLLAFTMFTFAVFLLPGMLGAPLKAFAGYLPPMSTHDFDLNRIIREANGKTVDACGEPKYGDKLHLPHGLSGYFDYDQGMACAKEVGKPVFIDFTGHGCVNCRKMEEIVWSDPAVLKVLKNDFVIISLYTDDGEIELPKEEWYISKYDGKEIKTMSAKNVDREICDFGYNAQPYYVTLDHQGELLNIPTTYNPEVSDFLKFLNDSKAEFALRNAQGL